MANQVDFKILPSDQFNVYSPQTRSEKIITYFTLLSKLRGDILAVSSQDDPNNIVSAYYSNVGNTQTLHLVKADGSEVTASNSFAGTVTSVDMSVPTGFAISGNPITTSGTLNVSFASGYSLPTNALQATWTTAYNRSITSAAVTGTSTKTLTLNQQDGGTITASWSDIDTGLTSVGLSMPSAFAVANSPLTVNGTIAVTGAGTSAQYIRGDGQLANFPSSGGGGSTINYYLNGSVNQGTFGGTTYYEMSKTPIAGAGTNFTRTSAQGPGYIASFITDAGDPALLNIPGGNWNLEIYFNASSSGGGPSFYGELYKVSSSNVFTLIASNSANPEGITNGTTVDQYFTSIAVPQTTLLATDRLAVRIYVNPDGRNITLHTEDNNFCEVITTFSTGLNALNGLTAQVQYFATGTSGTDFNIDSVTDTHTFNLPTASGTNRGALSSSDWTTFNSKASDAFKTIAVTGQSNIVADSATDTLTFEAGSNIIITTDAATDKITITAVGGGSGSVTSVDMSVPTGFAISGNPITTSGTLALAFASGYSLPTTASQGNWNTAYNDSITAFSYNTSTGVLTLTQQDAGILTATVTLQPFTTDNLTQGSTNLYDKVVSLTGAGTTVVTGTYPNFTITSNDQHVGTVTSIATSAPITGGTITTSGTIGITQSGASTDGYLSSTDWNTFNSKVGGSGTVNYVSKWTSTGAIGNSQIFDSGTYVGINTATPAAKIDISGDHVASIGLLRLNSSASNIAAQTYYIDGVYKAATYAGTDDNFYILGRDADIVFSTTSSTTTRMVITNGGNVGIGTSGPTQKLMVSGSIRVTGGYYDSSNSIGSNGQVLASTGSGTTWINASGGTVNGSGTVNYIPKWTGTTLLADSQLFDNGTNVGVGTATPNRKLTVSGNGTLLGLQSSTAGGYSEMEFTADGVSGAYIFKASSGFSSYAGAGSLNIYNSGAIGFHTASVSNAMFIASATGNIGLGNTGPSQKLHVEGNIRVTGAYYDSANGAGSSGQVLSSTGSGTSWITPFSGSGTTNYVAKWTSGTAIGNSQIFDNGTNVGIGTASPTETLDLRGVLRVSRSGVNDSGIIAFGNYVNGAGYYDNGIFRSALNAITTSGNTLHMGSYEALAFTTSANPLGSQSIRMYISGSNGNVGIGTTSPSRLLHVAGNAQVDGWLFQGGYYTGSVTLPYPGANYGNGRIYLRLCSSASSRIMTARVRISSTWNWAPAFGSVEADISFYWTGSSMAYAYVNILSATGQAATNLTFGALEVEGGSISVPVYSTNSNPIYAYIQLSPDADPSQVSYSTWSSVAFPGQANVYIQTNLGVGTTAPANKLVAASDAIFNNENTYAIAAAAASDPAYKTVIGYSYSNDIGVIGAVRTGIGWRNISMPQGSLGIGTLSPSEKLHISGNIRVTGAYYDSSNAAGTSGQILSSTGTGTAWISPGGGGGIITGSGTTNYVTKWTGTSAVGDSSIYDNGNVGIGTSTPSYKLQVNGNAAFATNSGGLRIDSYDANTAVIRPTVSNGSILISDDSGTVGRGVEFLNGGGIVIQSLNTYDPLSVQSNGSTILLAKSSGNVGIGTADPIASLDNQGSAGTYRQRGLTTMVTNNLGAAGTQAKRFEIARASIDYNDWNTVGPIEVELYERYYSRGLKKKYVIYYGYVSSSGCNLVEMTGSGDNQFMVSIGPEVVISGDNRYIPIYVDVRYYSQVTAVLKTNRELTLTNPPGNGSIWMNNMPTGVDISDFTPDSTVYVGNIIGGNSTFATGNVGIGTITPDNKLTVKGPNALVDVQSDADGQTVGLLARYLNNNALGAGFRYTTGDAQLYIDNFYPGNNGVYSDITIRNCDTGGTLQTRIKIKGSSGNIGIGETAPSQKLHVSGNIRVTGAYYDSANSAGTSGQILSSTGTGTAWIAAPSGGGVSGSGTTNYITKWTSGSAVGDSIMYDAGTGIGVGTTTPLLTNTGRGNLTVNGSSEAIVTLGIGGSWASYYFVNSTAAYLSAGNPRALVLEAGNSARIFITSGGNVGIGTTSPSEKFVVSDGGAAGFEWVPSTGRWYRYNRSTSAYGGIYSEASEFTWSPYGSEAMRINGSGNVGIGTTAPNAKLQINDGTGSAEFLRLSVAYDTSRSARGGIYWHDTSNTTGRIYTEYDGTMTSMVFGSLYNSGYNSNNLMIIRGNGNVGIGTTSPASKLTVYDGDVRLYKNHIQANTATWSQQIYFTDEVDRIGAAISGFREQWTNAPMAISFSTGGLNTITERMRITSAGNVGIGTTAPNAKLDVAGGINTRNTRVNSAEKYPVGHYSFGETVFEIDPTWTEAQLQDFFNTSGVSWIADSTAPGGYAIQIDGSVNVGAGEYDSGFPYIPVDNSQDDWYYMECYIKNDAGSSIQHYMGGIDFNQSFASLGGNPGSYTYNVMFNYNPGTSWTKVYGYWNGFGSSYGSAGTGNTNNWVSGTKYFTPQALFNYGLNSGIRRCYISGWKCVRVRATGNRYYSNNVLVSGNVGIGTTAPQVKTHIYTATDISLAYDEGQYGLWVSQTSTSKSLILGYSNTFNAGIINAVHSGVAWRNILIATNGGNVGIGTTAPLHNLSVAGKIGGATFSDSYVEFPSSGHTILKANNDVIVGYSQSFYVKQGGNVGIGTTAPLQKLHVVGAVVGGNTGTTGLPNTSGVTTQLAFEARSTQFGNDPSIAYHKEAIYTMYLQGQNSPRGLRLYSPTGESTANFYVQGDVVAFSSSDRRLKDNLSPIPNALEKVSKLTGYEFDWNENQSAYTGHDYGVVAQEVEAVMPELVQTREDGYKAVKYDKIVAVLIEAIKEQQKQIDELKAKLK